MFNKYKDKVIAVDFDGTLCKNRYPLIGFPKKRNIKRVLKAQKNGASIILWTCREGELLHQAVKWCNKFGLYFEEINNNISWRISVYNNDCRKVGADEYWDDRARRMR